jgi:hypothetical protein
MNGERPLRPNAAEQQKFLDDIRSISRALEQAKRGEGRAMRECLEVLATEHGISLK